MPELLERASQLEELSRLLAAAQAGSGRMALVSGEAGIGKTALVRQFTAGLPPRLRLAMLYAPGPQGQLQLGAVAYIVPAAPWDAENNVLPEVLGQQLHLNETLGFYVLHAWVWQHNPSGMSADWNPRVSCP